VEKLTAPFLDRIQTDTPVRKVKIIDGGRARVLTDRGEAVFDKVIFACHGHQALALIDKPDTDEARLLDCFHYQYNLATLHTDEGVMPKTKMAWSAWNYCLQSDSRGHLSPSTIYWMNDLQGVSKKKNYFVSVNGEENIATDRILKKIPYEHPLFSTAARAAQKELPLLNRPERGRPFYFCGAYFKYGFHEDGFASGLELSRILSPEPIWG
jgi:predicted NAD/FAD-binding protein